MAKKKKRKSKNREEAEPNLFWRQAAAVLLFVAGFFLLLGGFGVGRPAPTKSFSAIYSGFGLAAYLTPVALFYFAVLKFRTDDHKVPLANSFSMIFLLVFLSSWLFTGF